MDKTDFEILRILSDNGRISHEELGKRLHLSRPAIHQRVEKLENEGLIKGYRAKIDWSKAGQVIKALIFLKISAVNFEAFSHQILQINIPTVVIEECQRLTGEWCIIIKIRTHSPGEITKLIDELWKIEGVRETSTSFVLSTVLD